MANFFFWQRWLLIVGILISVFGTLMALISGTLLFDPFNGQIDPVFWGGSVVEESVRGFQGWINSVWGATIAGWGIFVIFIARYLFRNREQWAWNCLVTGIIMWFVLDTSLSIFHKVYFNAAFNSILLILAMLPIVITRKYFTKE